MSRSRTRTRAELLDLLRVRPLASHELAAEEWAELEDLERAGLAREIWRPGRSWALLPPRPAAQELLEELDDEATAEPLEPFDVLLWRLEDPGPPPAPKPVPVPVPVPQTAPATARPSRSLVSSQRRLARRLHQEGRNGREIATVLGCDIKAVRRFLGRSEVRGVDAAHQPTPATPARPSKTSKPTRASEAPPQEHTVAALKNIEREKIIKLRLKGETVTSIAKTTGRSVSCIFNVLELAESQGIVFPESTRHGRADNPGEDERIVEAVEAPTPEEAPPQAEEAPEEAPPEPPKVEAPAPAPLSREETARHEARLAESARASAEHTKLAVEEIRASSARELAERQHHIDELLLGINEACERADAADTARALAEHQAAKAAEQAAAALARAEELDAALLGWGDRLGTWLGEHEITPGEGEDALAAASRAIEELRQGAEEAVEAATQARRQLAEHQAAAAPVAELEDLRKRLEESLTTEAALGRDLVTAEADLNALREEHAAVCGDLATLRSQQEAAQRRIEELERELSAPRASRNREAWLEIGLERSKAEALELRRQLAAPPSDGPYRRAWMAQSERRRAAAELEAARERDAAAAAELEAAEAALGEVVA